jgi:ribosomal-protein-alanine N-acetyltransferase
VDLPITTDRLRLKSFELGDAEAMHAVYSDEEVMRQVGDGPVADIGATEGMLRQCIAHQEEHGFSFWAVVEAASGAVIGDAGLYLLEGRGPEIEVGYTLGRAWWGRGYATEAAGACVAVAFNQLGAREVVAVADPANAASLRVLDKLGMARVGSRTAYGREHAFYRKIRPGSR